MKVYNITAPLYKGIEAAKAANMDRKLVRQVDTGKRKLSSMLPNTRNKYRKSVAAAGHYSKNPIKRLLSFAKALIANLK